MLTRGARAFAVVLDEFGFVVKEIDMGGSPGHEQINHPFGLRSEMQPLEDSTGFQRWIRFRCEQPLIEEGCKCRGANPGGGPPKELAARDQ